MIARDVLFITEVAAALGCSRRSIERYQRSGRWPIPEVQPRLGKRPRFRRVDVENYIRGTAGRRSR